MDKENKLLRKAGTGNPFSVPQGYFTDFTQDLMSKLPEKEPSQGLQEISLWQRIKPWIYMTAMFCGIMLSVRIFVGEPKQQTEIADIQPEIESISEEDWEIMTGSSLIDDYSFYEYLTEADTNANF